MTSQPRTFTDVGCTVCGCVCDDLAVTVADGRVVEAKGACRLADPWFRAQNSAAPPAALLDGRPSDPGAAFARAAELLRAARYPLIYGLSRSTTEGQRAAAALADRLGATIDTTASTGHAPSIMALQQVGESTCTLGEVKNRADLVVFWGSDPAVTHPRHLERYAADPVGRWVPGGRSGRVVVVVDEQETETAKLADLFVQIPAAQNWEALWELRMRMREGNPPPGPLPSGRGREDEPELARVSDAVGGSDELPLPSGRGPGGGLPSLARAIAAAKCGVFFFGAGVTRGRQAHRTVEALLQLVTDLNDRGRFYARRMRRFGDVAGADSVLAWQTGYPFGVNLSRGYPRYNPGEFTGPEMLARGEPDLCLLIGSETVADFPPESLEHLKRIPVIALDPPEAEPPVPAAVRFTTAVYGVHRPGTAYRMDEVPVPLRVLLPTDYPSDAEVLNELLSRVRA
ncbi:formylmethanofuran dehydrogenase subunit B [Gemmata sp. JC717]|uniref:formylmethanofuran dehydrogenase subunit B n=1 Tax=Gemmata algarum TaxID=2975278 RepID=UPI0021BAEF53|nr:formylmethanofuran dehydrogenase subunit B [Gemmata algarum]MDY3554527.1 formylmethanofuran dehydrogenase subunit B [Gemmata algarum]